MRLRCRPFLEFQMIPKFFSALGDVLWLPNGRWVLENKHLPLPPIRDLPEILPCPGLKIGSPRHQEHALIQAAKRPGHPTLLG